MTTIKTLFQNNILKTALSPQDNPERLDASVIVMPLIEHDYPAKTPVMWNACYRELGMSEYANLMAVGSTEHLDIILDGLRTDPRYVGGGAGVGFKDSSFSKLDTLDETAQAVGSINLISKKDGVLTGHNTDGEGYAMGLEDLIAEHNRTPLSESRVLMFGSGGTANPIAFALAKRGAKLVISNRTVEKAVSLADRVNRHFGTSIAIGVGEDEVATYASTSDVLINVSTKGASGRFEDYAAFSPTGESVEQNLEMSRAFLEHLNHKPIVSDILLRGNTTTPTLTLAQEFGLITQDGLPMVINQGVKAFMLLHEQEVLSRGYTEQDIARIMREAAST